MHQGIVMLGSKHMYIIYRDILLFIIHIFMSYMLSAILINRVRTVKLKLRLNTSDIWLSDLYHASRQFAHFLVL